MIKSVIGVLTLTNHKKFPTLYTPFVIKLQAMSFLICKNTVFKWVNQQTLMIRRKKIYESIESNDVVVFEKVGCGFCEKAIADLTEQRQTIHFSLDIVVATDRGTTAALKSSLRLQDITFPLIIIRGKYVGGCDDLRVLIQSREFSNILRSTMTFYPNREMIVWYPPLEEIFSNPKLLTVPSISGNSTSWYCFQWYIYSNLVRFMSIFHLVMMFFILLCLKADNSNRIADAIGDCLTGVLVVDLGLFVLFGASPMSISGTLSTYFGWKYKGNVTSSIPYKVVFLIYLVLYASYLATPRNLDNTGSTEAIVRV